MAYDCNEYEWRILENRLKMNLSKEDFEKAMKILRNFCGLEYSDLSIIANNIIKQGVK